MVSASTPKTQLKEMVQQKQYIATYLCHLLGISFRCNGSLGNTHPLTLLASLFSPSCGSGIHPSLSTQQCCLDSAAGAPTSSLYPSWPGSGCSLASMCKYHSARQAVRRSGPETLSWIAGAS